MGLVSRTAMPGLGKFTRGGYPPIYTTAQGPENPWAVSAAKSFQTKDLWRFFFLP